MSDFLDNLLARCFHPAALVQPRLPSLYEPVRSYGKAPGFPVNEAFGSGEMIDPERWVGESPGSPLKASPTEIGAKSPPRKGEPSAPGLSGRPPSPVESSQQRPGSRENARPFSGTTGAPVEADAEALPPEGQTPSELFERAEASVPSPVPGPLVNRASTQSDSGQSQQGKMGKEALPAGNISTRTEIQPDGNRGPTSPSPRLAQPALAHEVSSAPAKISRKPAAIPVKPQSLARAKPEVPVEGKPGTTPSIRVTIGRVEVRAVMAPALPLRPKPKAAPRLSLEDYLRSRKGSDR